MSRFPAKYLNYYPLLGVWLLVVIVSISIRPILPVDETRYLSVAWEMWLNGNYLVPFKNGLPYPDKPPLLFWLIHFGWWIFGVNEWWPRLVAPLLALSCIPLIHLLSVRLWPDQKNTGKYASWLLFGCIFWIVFMTMIQFDLLLVVFTLIGMLGWIDMSSRKRFSFLPAIAIGLGLLAKGPVIMVHLLPAGLLAPFWVGERINKNRWYFYCAISVVLGLLIALIWVVPAIFSGGDEYRDAILWGQTANRVVNSFAHQKAWWWYIPMLLLLFFPWALWPAFWRSLGCVKADFLKEPGVKFLICWIFSTVIIFSLISGKQIKYLLPVLPALMLLFASALTRLSDQANKPWVAGILLIVVGLLINGLPFLVKSNAYWISTINPIWSSFLIVIGVLVLLIPKINLFPNIQIIAISIVLIVLSLSLDFRKTASEAYDLKLISQKASSLLSEGKKVAYLGRYHAEFNFLGKFREPLIEVSLEEAIDWARINPDAYVILQRGDWPGLQIGAIYEQPYRSDPQDLGIWRADDWLAALPKNFPNRPSNK